MQRGLTVLDVNGVIIPGGMIKMCLDVGLGVTIVAMDVVKNT